MHPPIRPGDYLSRYAVSRKFSLDWNDHEGPLNPQLWAIKGTLRRKMFKPTVWQQIRRDSLCFKINLLRGLSRASGG